MFTDSIDYTICSTDESHYNRINCNLTAPVTKYSALTVTCLTANCDIVVLNSWDYIVIDGKQFSFETGFTNLNAETFVGLLNDLFTKKEVTYQAQLDSAGRFKIICDKKFIIERMTYHSDYSPDFIKPNTKTNHYILIIMQNIKFITFVPTVLASLT